MSHELTDGDESAPFAVPPALAPRTTRERWQAEFGKRLEATDFVVVTVAVGLAQVIRFGGPAAPPLAWSLPYEVGYTVVSALLVVAWMTLLLV